MEGIKPGADGAAECSGVVQVGGHAVFAGLPLLAEESAAREVIVEVVGEILAEALEDGGDEVHKNCIFEEFQCCIFQNFCIFAAL